MKPEIVKAEVIKPEFAPFNGTELNPIDLDELLADFSRPAGDLLGDLHDNVEIIDENPGGLPQLPFMPSGTG